MSFVLRRRPRAQGRDPLSALIPNLLDTLERFRVPERDREDLCQEILLAAIEAIREGRYHPTPGHDPLKRWTFGIAWRQISHYRTILWRKRETYTPDEPDDVSDLFARLEAREILGVIEQLPKHHQDAICLRAAGHNYEEIGAILGVKGRTACNWVLAARETLLTTPKRGRK